MIRLEPLTGHHARDEFDCGAEPLNRWLAQTALQHQVKGISRTIVAISCDESVEDAAVIVEAPRVLGFYALAAGFVRGGRHQNTPVDFMRAWSAVPRLSSLNTCS